MSNLKTVLLIGGGTGGHILPLKNLAEELDNLGSKVKIIVSNSDLDRKIIHKNFSSSENIIYFKTGKIRRYLSLQNLVDFFKIIGSIFKARKILKEIHPDVLFFKGGFVGFPFFIAAKFFMRFQGKIYSHESDIVPGILTRMVSKYADEVFESFGNPSMPLFYSASEGKKQLKVSAQNPHQSTFKKSEDNKNKKILIFGASQGAQFINETFLTNAPVLCEKYHITLISGLGKEIEFAHKNLEQFTLISAEDLSQKIHESDLIISRAGSSSLFEILTAKKPSIIIPLPSAAQNHQVKNAEYFQKKNLCVVLQQSPFLKDIIMNMIETTLNNPELIKALRKSKIENMSKQIAKTLLTKP